MAKYSTITFKISALVSISIIASVLILSAVYVILARQKASTDILKNSLIFAEVNSQPIYQDYLVSTSPRFTTLLFNRMSKNQDIVEISMIGFDGRIYFDSKNLQIGNTTQASDFVDIASLGSNFQFIEDPETLKMVKNETTVYRSIYIDGKMYEEIVVPVKETETSHIVSVRYLVSYASLSQSTKDIFIQTLIIIPVCIIFIIAATILSQNIIYPLRQLFLAFEQVRIGNYNVVLETKSNDEIGQLSQTFNQMIQSFKENQLKQQEYQHNLETEVSKRTEELNQKLNELESLNKIMVGREIKMIELKKEIASLKNKKNNV